eukprot:m.71782 g.71782  ORF g.71782 m.71782 type:complete len:478 (+) comp8737_c0_seq2:62-1495(+)
MRWVWMVTTAMVVSWSQQTARATDTPTPASPSPASSIPPTDTPMLTSTLVPEITSSSTSGGGPSAPAGPIVVMNIEDRQPAAVSAQPHTILIEINRTLAPLGAERFLRLVQLGFYNDSAIFRVIPGFVAQWGVSGDTSLNAIWAAQPLPDEPVLGSNTLGTIAFATAGPDTRTTEVFVNLANNSQLDQLGFSPFGHVVQGLDLLQRFSRVEVEQPEYDARGNAWVRQLFPNANFIVNASVRGYYGVVNGSTGNDGPIVPTFSPTPAFPMACTAASSNGHNGGNGNNNNNPPGSGSGSGSGQGGSGSGQGSAVTTTTVVPTICSATDCNNDATALLPDCDAWCAECSPAALACDGLACEGVCRLVGGVASCDDGFPTAVPTAAPTATPTGATPAPTTETMVAVENKASAAHAAASVAVLLAGVLITMCVLHHWRSSSGAHYSPVGLTEELNMDAWNTEEDDEYGEGFTHLPAVSTTSM